MDSGASWDPNRDPGVFRDPTNMDPIGNTWEQRPWTNRLPEPQNPVPEIQMNQNQNQIQVHQGFTYSLDFTTHCAIDNWYKKYCGDDQAPELQNPPGGGTDNNFLEAPQLQISQMPANDLEVVIEENHCVICNSTDQVMNCYEVQMCKHCSLRFRMLLEIVHKGGKPWGFCSSADCGKCQKCQLKPFLEAGVDLSNSKRFSKLVIKDQTSKVEKKLTCLVCSNDKNIYKYRRILPICHQCKCFFYRYRTQKIQTIRCKKGKCPLTYDPNRPYQYFCPCCRYKKCLEIGMGPEHEYSPPTEKSITPPAPIPPKVPEVPKTGDCAICGRKEAIECRFTMMEASRRVLTCLNCKRFFRRFSDIETRKTMGQTECSFKNCKIEHDPRFKFQRHCNYCRFQKCLRVGLVGESAIPVITLDDGPYPKKALTVQEKETCVVCGKQEATQCRVTKSRTDRHITACGRCKIFFRHYSDPANRQEYELWECKTKNCEIIHDPNIPFQKHCDYCRFQKCLKVGMNREKDPHKEPILDILRNYGGNDYSNPGTSSNIQAAYMPPPIQNGPYFGFNYQNQYSNNYPPANNFSGYDYNQFGPYYQYY